MVSDPFTFQYLHSSRSGIGQTFTYRTDLTSRPLDSSFMLQFRTPQFHNRILCLTALYPRANASKPQIYNTSTTNQRHFLHIVALNFATIFFFFFRSSNMRDLPLTALYQTSALKSPPRPHAKRLRTAFKFSREEGPGAAHTQTAKTHRYRQERAKNKKKSLVFQKDLQTTRDRLFHHGVVILNTRSQLLVDNFIFALRSVQRRTRLAFTLVLERRLS